MAIPTSIAGSTQPALTHEIDERWTMAYAAALGAHAPCYLDTTAAEKVVAHPMFIVGPEWEAIVRSRAQSEELGITRAEVLTSVHATHDVSINRLIRPGDVLSTSLQIVGCVQISPGAKSTTRLTTTDQHGEVVAITTQDGIYLAVPTEGEDIPDPAPPSAIEGQERIGEPSTIDVRVDAGAAHVYTECARIWNPIHTDPSVALASGLPDIILHGTANLAHGVSGVIDGPANGDPHLVRRIQCRFRAMVRLPSTMTVRVWPANETSDGRQTVPFEVLNEEGQPAVENGLVVLGAP